MGNCILEMKSITKNYGGIQALTDVTLELNRGEILCLCGENGAGKSTLMKILTGVEQPTSGEIYLDGKLAHIAKPLDAYNAGISIVHQELVQIPKMTIAENIFIGRYDLTCGFINRKALREKTRKLMERLNIYYDPDSLIRQYSVAQRQLIEILKALSFDSRIIVLDEPTAALTIEETRTLYRIVRKLKEDGVSVIFISHRMEDIYAVGDRVYVLKDGKHSGTANVKDVSTGDIVRMMIGRELGQQFVPKTNTPGEVVLEVRHLSNHNIHDISLKVRKGEVLGIGGLIGAGRTELLRAIFGIDDYEGDILYNGETIRNRSPREAIQRGFAFVPEDRKDLGLILSHSIKDNILMSIIDRLAKLGFVNRRQEREIPERYISELNIKTPNAQLKAGALSGGNQQKVVLGKALASQPSVILLDEPTRGVDVGAKAEIYRIINDLTCKGYAVIMVSSELPELIAMSDRIVVMHDGHISGELEGLEATEEAIMHMAI